MLTFAQPKDHPEFLAPDVLSRAGAERMGRSRKRGWDYCTAAGEGAVYQIASETITDAVRHAEVRTYQVPGHDLSLGALTV